MANFPKIPLPWEKIAAFALEQLLTRFGKQPGNTALQRARMAFVVAKSHGDILDTPRTQQLEAELMSALQAELAPAPNPKPAPPPQKVVLQPKTPRK